MSGPLPTVHFFWHGPPLSRVEQLALASFVRHGHPVELHAYDELGGVPAGVRITDASRTLPREAMFVHKRTGSLALFADWFRYRLLLERGGIWADADVVCLQPLRYADEVILGWSDADTLNNAVLGLPAGHELAAWMAACCERPNRVLPYDGPKARLRKWWRRVMQGDRRERVGWGEYGPKGLKQAAQYLGYAARALQPEHFYPVACHEWYRMFEPAGSALPWSAESRAVHLWNNMFRERPGFDKRGRFPPDSPFETLWRRYCAESGSALKSAG